MESRPIQAWCFPGDLYQGPQRPAWRLECGLSMPWGWSDLRSSFLSKAALSSMGASSHYVLFKLQCCLVKIKQNFKMSSTVAVTTFQTLSTSSRWTEQKLFEMLSWGPRKERNSRCQKQERAALPNKQRTACAASGVRMGRTAGAYAQVHVGIRDSLRSMPKLRAGPESFV